jgi:hypothetical protein
MFLLHFMRTVAVHMSCHLATTSDPKEGCITDSLPDSGCTLGCTLGAAAAAFRAARMAASALLSALFPVQQTSAGVRPPYTPHARMLV